MNAALVVDNKRTVLAAGMGKQCHLFSLRYKLEEEEEKVKGRGENGTTIPKGETAEDQRSKMSNGEIRRRKPEGGEKDEKGGGDRASDGGAEDHGGKNGFVNHHGKMTCLTSFIFFFQFGFFS